MTSTMIGVKVDKADPTDLYEQVAGEIRRAIAEGEAKPGERLPPAKDLAAVLGVNTNTVLRALRVLRDEGLLEFRRGRGISVAGTPERGAVVARARELVDFARLQGYRAGRARRRSSRTSVRSQVSHRQRNGQVLSVRHWVVAAAAVTLVGVSAAASATPPETDINQAGATAIKASGDWLAAGVGGVWLSDPPARVIRRLHPKSGAVTTTIRVPAGPCEASDVGFGALWTATCNRPGLARIDPVRNIQKGFVSLEVPGLLDGEGSVGAGAGGVWLVVDGRRLPRLSRCARESNVDEGGGEGVGARARSGGQGRLWRCVGHQPFGRSSPRDQPPYQPRRRHHEGRSAATLLRCGRGWRLDTEPGKRHRGAP